MKYWTITYLLSSYTILICSAQERTLTDKMIEKICNVVKDKLSIHESPPDKREEILENIKEKLVEQAEKQGSKALEHIDLIVQGVAVLSDEKNFERLCIGNEPGSTTSIAQTEIDNSMTASMQRGSNTSADVTSKQNQVMHIITKLTDIVERALKQGNTKEEKQLQIKKVKQKIIESLEKKDKTAYIDAIVEGFDLTVEKLLSNDSRRMSEMILNIVGAKLETIGKPQAKPNKTAIAVSTFAPLLGIPKDNGCSKIMAQICTDLKTIDVFKCSYDDTTLSTQQVCDGVMDCPDGSDEKNCIKQVISKVHSATKVMSKVELSRSCFKSLADDTLVSRQGEMLYGLLKKEIDFLNKYDILDAPTTHMPPVGRKTYVPENRPQFRGPIDEIAAEVAVVVRTFATSLIGALCNSPVQNDDELAKKVEALTADTFDAEVKSIVNERYYSAKFCECDGEFCKGTCLPQCKRLCYLKDSFGKFSCKTIRNQHSVYLDAICDGINDCYDNSDETNCAGDSGLSKFEGSRIYDKILKILKTKTMSTEYQPVRSTLVDLYSEIQNLHKLSMDHEVKLDVVKTVRNNCIKLFQMAYADMMNHVGGQEGEAVYMFLSSLNDKLLEAMKRTHTGNVKIAVGTQCICRNGGCAQAICPPLCTRLCHVKFLLTNYACTSSNLTLPLDTVCNGKINCPEAEDEHNCQSGVCHASHLKDLHFNIQNVGAKYKGSAVGDALDTWKAKATATIFLAESNSRLTPKIFRQTVAHLLSDLSTTYASLEDHHDADHDLVMKKFVKLSQRIIDSLKTCNK